MNNLFRKMYYIRYATICLIISHKKTIKIHSKITNTLEKLLLKINFDKPNFVIVTLKISNTLVFIFVILI